MLSSLLLDDNAEVTFGLLQTASSPAAGFCSLGEYAQERGLVFQISLYLTMVFLARKSVRLSFTFTSPLTKVGATGKFTPI